MIHSGCVVRFSFTSHMNCQFFLIFSFQVSNCLTLFVAVSEVKSGTATRRPQQVFCESLRGHHHQYHYTVKIYQDSCLFMLHFATNIEARVEQSFVYFLV